MGQKEVSNVKWFPLTENFTQKFFSGRKKYVYCTDFWYKMKFTIEALILKTELWIIKQQINLF